MKRRAGFTLLELLVVIGLIGILMALLLPAIIKVKNSGQEKRIAVNARAIATAIDAYKSRYHNWPADVGDLKNGVDVTYGLGSKDNRDVIGELIDPPNDGEPFLDLSDFIVDSDGNVLKSVGGNQYKITLDLNGDYSPSGGVKVE